MGKATPINTNTNHLPIGLRDFLDAHLVEGEQLVGWFEPDLDHRLRYGGGWVALTDRRILASASLGEPAGSLANGNGADGSCHSWLLNSVSELRCRERGSVGSLDLIGRDSQLVQWRYTIGRAPMAHRFAEQFFDLNRPAKVEEEQAEECCPSCGQKRPTGCECPVCVPPAGEPPTKSLFRLTRFARPRAGMIAVAFLLTLTSTAAGLIPPYLTMPLLDNVLVPFQAGLSVDKNLIYWYLAGLAGASVLAWLLSWGRGYIVAWVSERVSVDLRNATYAHLQTLSLEYYGAKRTGDLISRVSSDTDRICYFLSVYLIDSATDVLMILMTVGILLSIDPLLTLVTLCPLPIIAWLVYRVRCRLRRAFQRASCAWAEMTSVLADTIPGIRVVKAFAQERRETERFQDSNRRVLEANDRVNRTWSYFGPLVVLLTDFGLLVIWAFGSWLIFNHQITVGVLTAFLAYITRFYTRLESMSRMVAAVQRAAASTQRVFEILDRAPNVSEPVRPVRPERLEGAISLHDVNFRYGSRMVLENVNLNIRPGEMIGLVGPSGAGKTTLVNLICRFYDVREGQILVDGHDIRSLPLEFYRRHIGIVLQESFLFYGTIAENIAYGRPDASREQIIAAARAARAHEFILRLPDGYDSLVGERGQSLSGGERQRIAIARALLIDPKILILDEATSSVDTETEREIQVALENLVRGRTTVAIAHRLSTLRRADRLVVLEQGKIREIGRHDELLDRSGVYARLYRAQLEMSGAGAATL